MTATIPASDLVNVVPGVLGPGGTAADLIGLALTNNARVPIGAVQPFPTATAVGAYFGLNSPEQVWASVYFAGFDNSRIKPASLLFAQYPSVAVPAYLRGGNVSSLSLTELQAISGTLDVTINGVAHTGTVNLSSATSFSNAASLIGTALAASDASFTGSITGTALAVSAIASGAIAIGQVVAGAGVTAGTVIVSGSGESWTVSPSQTVESEALTSGAAVVSYDSVSGAFVITGGTPGVTSTIGFASGSAAAALELTSATGAVTSQGAAPATPAAFMDGILEANTSWFTLSTLFEPSTADGLAFSTWTSEQTDQYAFIGFDTDINATMSDQTTTLAAEVIAAGNSGTVLLYEPSDLHQEAFVAGLIASIDFTARNGRVNPTYKSQAGITPGVTSQAIASQLRLNGYNFYGIWGSGTQLFQGLSPGSITGPFLWMDDYVNQRWLNGALQNAIMNLLFSSNFIPFNSAGATLIKAACNDPIQAGLNNGVIQSGVQLSSLQIAEVNAAAGLPIDATLFQQGWYLQVNIPSATVRSARGPWPLTFWYTSGGSVQTIALFSQDVL